MINMIEKEVNLAISGVISDDKVQENVRQNLVLLSSATDSAETLS